MKKVLYIIIGLALLASCEKEIDFKGEQTEPKLVINSKVEPGQPVSAAVGKSCFFLDEEMDRSMPSGAMAQLYVNDNFISNMDLVIDSIEHLYYTYNGDSIGYKIEKHFESDYRPQSGDIVKITASAPGFDDVEGSTSQLPKNTECSILDYKILEWEGYYVEDYMNEGDSAFYAYFSMELTIEITDPNPGQTDFFMLHFINGSRYDDMSNFVTCTAEYTDPVFGGSVSSSEILDALEFDSSPENVFTDVLFDGRSYQIKLPLRMDYRRNSAGDPDLYRVPIPIEHLSKEYYKYLNTCEQNIDYMQFFSEPIQTYTNVTNGYGIVGGCASDTLWFDLPYGR